MRRNHLPPPCQATSAVNRASAMAAGTVCQVTSVMTSIRYAPDDAARVLAGGAAVLIHDLAVDPHLPDAERQRRRIGHRRLVDDFARIEQHQIRVRAGGNHTSILHAEMSRGESGHL